MTRTPGKVTEPVHPGKEVHPGRAGKLGEKWGSQETGRWSQMAVRARAPMGQRLQLGRGNESPGFPR